jgi:membrane protein DedA with SNARE-associated domain
LNFPSILEHFPYPGLFILLILGGIGFPLPEDTTLILCGFLISTKIIKPIPALLTVYSGLLATDFFLHYVGKKYGRAVVDKRKFRKILTPERLSRLEEKFRRRGILIILVGRHVAGLRAQIFIVSGVVKMSSIKFLVADAFSSLFTIALMVGAGYAGGNSLQIIRRDITRVEHIGILLIVFLFVIFIFFKFYRYRHDNDGRVEKKSMH